MVQVILSVILAAIAIFMVILLIKNKKINNDQCQSVLGFSISFAIILAVTNIVPFGRFTDYIVTEDATETETFSIVALQDNNQVTGTKYVGIGYVREKMYYCFYEEADQGYKYHKLSPEDYDIYIKECSNDEKPHIEETTEIKNTIIKKDPSSLFWFSLVEYLEYKNCKVGDIVDTSEKFIPDRTYTIYVPKGTIVEDYKIDME